MRRTRTVLLCIAGLVAATLPAGAAAAAAPGGCVRTPGPARGQAADVLELAEQAKRELGLNSLILRVSKDGKELVTTALGESVTGVPADPAMHFRSGSVAIAYMATVLLQLVEEGRAGLDDTIDRWLPDAPHAKEITLRQLGNSTSGLHDYVTDPKFLAELEAAPFRHWTSAEVIGIAAAHPLWYPPGTNFSYSHANFQLLGAALEKISGVSLERLLQERVMRPLGLGETANGATPEIPVPALHSFTSDRGIYEESSYWNPSWTTAPGAVLTTDICDLERSARAIGTGELLSPESFRTQLDPGTVGLGSTTDGCPATVCLKNTREAHFGFGVLVDNGWIEQNPSFSGYAAIQAYLPAEKLAIAVSATKGPKTPEGNQAQTVAERISALLAPDRPLKSKHPHS
ncbi:serine hydrolase domain-containing protein [Streptomyces sp. NPDC048270]|uniref:serine hydrolase domain-containing protein n=1 Tax=Streptomyces sp. NPDC048270 TaxID=3154615 RepID=UPI0033CCA6BA